MIRRHGQRQDDPRPSMVRGSSASAIGGRRQPLTSSSRRRRGRCPGAVPRRRHRSPTSTPTEHERFSDTVTPAPAGGPRRVSLQPHTLPEARRRGGEAGDQPHLPVKEGYSRRRLGAVRPGQRLGSAAWVADTGSPYTGGITLGRKVRRLVGVGRGRSSADGRHASPADGPAEEPPWRECVAAVSPLLCRCQVWAHRPPLAPLPSPPCPPWPPIRLGGERTIISGSCPRNLYSDRRTTSRP